MRWEHCKRNTKCKDCGKTMVKGEARLMSRAQGARPYYKETHYRCQVCGAQFLFKHPTSQVEWHIALIPESIKETEETIKNPRLRLLRPIDN